MIPAFSFQASCRRTRTPPTKRRGIPIALTYFFPERFGQGEAAFRAYIAGNKAGQYLVDAQYRLPSSSISRRHQPGGDINKAREILEK